MAWKVDERIPKDLFIKLMIEKANVIKDHLKKSRDQLIIVANIGPTMAVFKLYDIKEEDSLKLQMTISNLGDIEEQIHQLWQQMNFLLQQYCTQCKSHFSNDIKFPDIKLKNVGYDILYMIYKPMFFVTSLVLGCNLCYYIIIMLFHIISFNTHTF